MNGFRRADINAGLAVDTHVLIDLCLVILHCDGRCRTFTHTGFASGTLGIVNDCYQLVHSTVILGKRQKKGFDITVPNFSGFLRSMRRNPLANNTRNRATTSKCERFRIPGKYKIKKNYFLRPSTSLIPYTPGFFPTTHRVARSAPLAKTERSYARCESSIVSKFLENMTL